MLSLPLSLSEQRNAKAKTFTHSSSLSLPPSLPFPRCLPPTLSLSLLLLVIIGTAVYIRKGRL